MDSQPKLNMTFVYGKVPKRGPEYFYINIAEEIYTRRFEFFIYTNDDTYPERAKEQQIVMIASAEEAILAAHDRVSRFTGTIKEFHSNDFVRLGEDIVKGKMIVLAPIFVNAYNKFHGLTKNPLSSGTLSDRISSWLGFTVDLGEDDPSLTADQEVSKWMKYASCTRLTDVD